jgi:hypothetical protein
VTHVIHDVTRFWQQLHTSKDTFSYATSHCIKYSVPICGFMLLKGFLNTSRRISIVAEAKGHHFSKGVASVVYPATAKPFQIIFKLPLCHSSLSSGSNFRPTLQTAHKITSSQHATMTSHSTACCSIPPIITEGYEPKGKYEDINGIKTCNSCQIMFNLITI